MVQQIRGLEEKQEYGLSDIVRETRPLGQQFADGARDPTTAAIAFAIAGAVIMASSDVGAFADILLLVGGFYWTWFRHQGKRQRLPLKMPQQADCLDFGDLDPGTSAPRKARGIMYVGNDRRTGAEIWINDSDARTHALYLGTTGAGKSEGIKSLLVNALCWGSGFIIVDGKADTGLWQSVYSLARRFGREDDVRILNYLPKESGAPATSNTLNPFAFGGWKQSAELLVSLMAEAGGDAMWKDRAVGLIYATMPPLHWLRDNKGLLLDAGVIRAHLPLAEIIKMSRRQDLPEALRLPLRAYLEELPGFVDDAFDDEGQAKPQQPGKQGPDLSTCREQHNFLTMQMTRALSSLSEDYANIFRTQFADIDMRDIVLRRRILVVLLPALATSPDELANLGKIVVANLKAMMGSTLGSDVEGDVREVIENKPTNSPSPYPVIFDEVGYYAVAGMDVMAAQARSLGYMLLFAAQDVPAMGKRIGEAVYSLIGNANFQIWGKLTDPGETRDLFEKSVGEAFVTESAGFSSPQNSLLSPYYDRNDATIQRRLRAEWLDIRDQVEGQVHITYGARLVRARMFYANVPSVRYLRVGKFLQVSAYLGSKVDTASAIEVRKLTDKMRSDEWSATGAAPRCETSVEIKSLMGGFAVGKKVGLSPVLCAGLALAAQDKPLQDKVNTLRQGLAGPSPAAPAEQGSANGAPEAQQQAMEQDAGGQRQAGLGWSADGVDGGRPAADDEHHADLGDAVLDASDVFDQVLGHQKLSLADEIAAALRESLCAPGQQAASDWVGDAAGGSAWTELVPEPQPEISPQAVDFDYDPGPDNGGWTAEVRADLEAIERSAGATREEAEAAAASVVDEVVEVQQRYPAPPTPQPRAPEDVAGLLKQIQEIAKGAHTAYR